MEIPELVEGIQPTMFTTWDDPLNQKLTGTITVDQLDKIYYDAVLELNKHSDNKAPLAKCIEKLYHVASMSCQNVPTSKS
jgi:hypothetical protein